MKNFYNNTNKESAQMKKITIAINAEIEKLKSFGNFANPDAFLEKYADSFFDTYRENEKDYEITNVELQKTFQIAYAYLQFLRACVNIEEDYENQIF